MATIRPPSAWTSVNISKGGEREYHYPTSQDWREWAEYQQNLQRYGGMQSVAYDAVPRPAVQGESATSGAGQTGVEQPNYDAGFDREGWIEEHAIQVPEYIAPEQVTGFEPPPEFQPPAIQQPQFYGLSKGDFEDIESRLYGQQMAAVRSEFGRRGAAPSGAYTTAAMRAKLGASEAALGLEAQEAQRRTRWEQDEAMRGWREAETEYRANLQTWQQQRAAQEREAAQRREWLWNTYMLPRQEYWQQIATEMQALQIPYSMIPLQSYTPQLV
jgi:hypothetical protein